VSLFKAGTIDPHPERFPFIPSNFHFIPSDFHFIPSPQAIAEQLSEERSVPLSRDLLRDLRSFDFAQDEEGMALSMRRG
jgi:hypothetical protein